MSKYEYEKCLDGLTSFLDAHLSQSALELNNAQQHLIGSKFWKTEDAFKYYYVAFSNLLKVCKYSNMSKLESQADSLFLKCITYVETFLNYYMDIVKYIDNKTLFHKSNSFWADLALPCSRFISDIIELKRRNISSDPKTSSHSNESSCSMVDVVFPLVFKNLRILSRCGINSTNIDLN